jgi:hypothetical protein
MVIKCNNIFYSKALGILPKLGILAWKQAIWQTCSRDALQVRHSFKKSYFNDFAPI